MSTEPQDKGPRVFELAHGVRVTKDPIDMTRQELEDSLYSLADFASIRIIEARTLKALIYSRLNGDTK